MATFTQLPSGSWRAQVGSGKHRKGKTCSSKADAKKWAATMEAQSEAVAAFGFAPPPKDTAVGDLIDRYSELATSDWGRTKRATLAMWKREMGTVPLSALASKGPLFLRDWIDARIKAKTSGATIAEDLSFLSNVLQWGRFARHWDIPANLAREARASLKHMDLRTRSHERTREPSDTELERLYTHWRSNPRQRIPMEVICRFAGASGMRQDEICRIMVEDVDRVARTVIIRKRKDPRNKATNDQTVPLLPEAWKIVEPLIRERTAGKVFVGVYAASVSTAFTRACTALDIKDLHFHDLRHRATVEFFRMGLDIPRVALLTGHKTWAMLKRYTEIKPEDVHAAIEARQPRTKRKPKRTAAVLPFKKTA
jgi:integrase